MKTPEIGKDTNVLRKTPEDIKKNLGRCLDRWAPVHFESCESDCPYHSEGTLCKETLHLDVLTYIQQIEAELDDEKNKNEILIFDTDKLMEEIAQAERERDAAVADLDKALTWDEASDCHFCKHRAEKRPECKWEWRGPCPENAKEDANEQN